MQNKIYNYEVVIVHSAVQVLNFQAEREFTPLGQSMSFTCTVQGRAVWRLGVYYFNTDSSDFIGNVTYVVPGINISDSTTSSGAHLSKLFLSSSIVESLNNTEVECGATSDRTTVPTEFESIRMKVFGETVQKTSNVCNVFQMFSKNLHKILFCIIHHSLLIILFPSGSPTTPGNFQVVSEMEREVRLTWEPSFLPFEILPCYNVYVDNILEATVDQPSFVFSREEHSCDSHMIRVEAFNEVGTSASDHEEVVLPGGECSNQ